MVPGIAEEVAVEDVEVAEAGLNMLFLLQFSHRIKTHLPFYRHSLVILRGEFAGQIRAYEKLNDIGTV